MLKCISFNVNGFRAIMKKDFTEDFARIDADIFALQETKLQEGQHDFTPEGYEQFWHYAVKKGYSGTAIFTKRSPLAHRVGIDIPEHDNEGRVLTLEFSDFYFVNVYTPNAQNKLRRIDYRMEWEDAFQNFVAELDKHKPVIVCGDLNVAHNEIDLKRPDQNRQNAGFSDQERGKFNAFLDRGFVDTFRHFYPDKEEAYTWWDYKTRARDRNVGWRIDYFLTSERLRPALKDAHILNEVYGSDHCPVQLDIEL